MYLHTLSFSKEKETNIKLCVLTTVTLTGKSTYISYSVKLTWKADKREKKEENKEEKKTFNDSSQHNAHMNIYTFIHSLHSFIPSYK